LMQLAKKKKHRAVEDVAGDDVPDGVKQTKEKSKEKHSINDQHVLPSADTSADPVPKKKKKRGG